MSRYPRLLNLPHVHMSTKSTAINTVVTFSCDPGYILVGNRRITCTPIGEWNGMQPMCMRELKCIKIYRLQTNHHIVITEIIRTFPPFYRSVSRHLSSLAYSGTWKTLHLQYWDRNTGHLQLWPRLCTHRIQDYILLQKRTLGDVEWTSSLLHA